jgi:hypothetical protein
MSEMGESWSSQALTASAVLPILAVNAEMQPNHCVETSQHK